jgi:hypothetical protein
VISEDGLANEVPSLRPCSETKLHNSTLFFIHSLNHVQKGRQERTVTIPAYLRNPLDWLTNAAGHCPSPHHRFSANAALALPTQVGNHIDSARAEKLFFFLFFQTGFLSDSPNTLGFQSKSAQQTQWSRKSTSHITRYVYIEMESYTCAQASPRTHARTCGTIVDCDLYFSVPQTLGVEEWPSLYALTAYTACAIGDSSTPPHNTEPMGKKTPADKKNMTDTHPPHRSTSSARKLQRRSSMNSSPIS